MKLDLKRLFFENRMLKAGSLLIAIVGWFIVVVTISPDTTTTVRDVPVQFNDMEESAVGRLGLNVIDGGEVKADVFVNGIRYVVGGLEKEDIEVVPEFSNVTEPGVYTLNLKATDKNGKGFDVVSVKPATIEVKFDRLASKKLPIETEIVGLSVPEGYLMQNEIVSPNELLITGPEIEVNAVERCVAVVEVNKTLQETFNKKTVFKLYDKDDNEITSKYITADVTEVNITVPILKTKIVPLKIDFINVPSNFPSEEFKYTLSNETIEIAGPVNRIDTYEEVTLGYVDIKNMDLESAFDFDVVLPSGFTNVENIQSVHVEFDTTGMTSKNFNVSNIKVINIPATYDVKVTTKQLSGVRMIGPSNIIATLTAGDIVAEIDLSDREIVTGQYHLPVKVYAPGSGLVWAYGDYEAVVTIKNK